MRKGSQLPPLAQPYEGPSKVLLKGPKFFTIEIVGREVTVTVDHLKRPELGTRSLFPGSLSAHFISMDR